MADTNKLVAKANNSEFYAKVLFFAFGVAQDVSSEPANTANHANRVKYAQYIFMGKESAVLLAAHIISANGQIQATIDAGNEPPDNDVKFVLASIWDARANAFAAV